MFCSKCGNELAEGSAFCDRCGNPISFQDAGSTQPIQEDQVSDAGAAKNLSEGAVPAEKKKKSKIAVPVIAVLLVAVIGIAAFATGGFGLLSDSSSNESVEEADANIESENNAAESENSIESDESGNGAKSPLEDYTWEELSTISAEIAAASSEAEAIEIAKKYNLVNEDGTLDGTQTKSVTLTDGTLTSVQIAGFLHDDKSDGSGKAGITFIFTDAIAEMYMNSDGSSDGGWESSDMRSWLASEGMALLPEDLQDVIVAVDKSTNNVGQTTSASSVTTTSDKLWLFSYVELVGELDESDSAYADIYNAEGSQYKLFSDCDVSISSYSSYILAKTYQVLAKTYQGNSSYWWGRSPSSIGPYYFMCVYSDGYPYGAGNADYSDAVVPGFCI